VLILWLSKLVGSDVGLGVGGGVGFRVGLGVGGGVGFRVGLGEGGGVGFWVGLGVGNGVGDFVSGAKTDSAARGEKLGQLTFSILIVQSSDSMSHLRPSFPRNILAWVSNTSSILCLPHLVDIHLGKFVKVCLAVTLPELSSGMTSSNACLSPPSGIAKSATMSK